MKKGLIFLALAGLCTYALCACRADEEERVQPLDAEEAEALKQDIAARDEAESDVQGDADDTYDVDVCYYLPSGGVWHADAACHHVAGKQNVVCGTVEEARAAGKFRACALCG